MNIKTNVKASPFTFNHSEKPKGAAGTAGLRQDKSLLHGRRFAVCWLVWVAASAALVPHPAQAAFVDSRSVWPNPVIPVCFEQDGYGTEKTWIRTAIAASWDAVSSVRFTGWDRCSPISKGIRVYVQEGIGSDSTSLGKTLAGIPNGVKIANYFFLLCAPGWTREGCVRWTAVHEFGHALGFAHEQNRDDTPPSCKQPQGPSGDTKVGPFDTMSVMNYCNPKPNGTISRGDIAGVRKFYGWSGTSAYPLNSGDLSTDLMIWRPGEAKWYELDIKRNSGKTFQLGQIGDIPVRMDADGDGRKDLAVWRPSDGIWRVMTSSNGGSWTGQLGENGDIPVPGDYDGDGIDDAAVWRPSNGGWYVLNVASGARSEPFYLGVSGDIPVPGDYDGDGIIDFAVWHPDGWWEGVNSSTGWWSNLWGENGDIPVPGDYDGDGRTDLAIWRPREGNWYVIKSSDGSSWVPKWGLAVGDVPVPADYDNDGRTDLAVWRVFEGKWYVINSSNGAGWWRTWGVQTDIPLGMPYGAHP